MSVLGPWVGMCNTKELEQLSKKQVALASDGAFTDGGVWEPRVLEELVTAGVASSVWQSKDGRVFAVVDGDLSLLSSGGAVEAVIKPAYGDVCYVDMPDYILASDNSGLFRIMANNAVMHLPPDAANPLVMTTSGGGLSAGKYTLAVAYTKNGEEGGPSHHVSVDVGSDGAIICTVSGHPDADGFVLYRSTPNGDVLYRAVVGELEPWGDSVIVREDVLGPALETQGLVGLPGLRCLAKWNGRVIGASGRYVHFSQPLRYGLHSPVRDYIQLPDYVTAIYPVLSGVFIGTTKSIYFAAGSEPSEWVLRRAANTGASGNALEVPGYLLDPELISNAESVGVFLTAVGHSLALPDGTIVHPQAGTLKLPVYSGGESFVLNQHVITIVKE